ncbi:MAG: hypothetical protein QW290_04935 [Sulfolobales archaeon]|uniref:Uncharacterized protein n=1 Tax=Ligamenvirales sp. TaxID=2832923 RepID=A0AAU6PX83_9VIRU
MDEVIALVRMSGGDYALIYRIARNERKTVNDWIMSCILEKLEKLQEEWMIKQKIQVDEK